MQQNTPAAAPARTPVHDLKCWPESFEPVLAGVKRAEIRDDDRHYEVGDTLILREWLRDPSPFPPDPVDGQILTSAPAGHRFAYTYHEEPTRPSMDAWITESPPCFAEAPLHNTGDEDDTPEQTAAHRAEYEAWVARIARKVGHYTGRWCVVNVTHVLRGAFNVPDGYVLLSLSDITAQGTGDPDGQGPAI